MSTECKEDTSKEQACLPAGSRCLYDPTLTGLPVSVHRTCRTVHQDQCGHDSRYTGVL